ncbi:MAG TPA: DUF1573 domain-containing protein [Chitinophagaceae bacterium]|nr:DUF1573 domain-containing protein [Chitinophagaceae bacterium]
MKRIFFVLLSGIAIMSCTEADNKSEDNSNNAAATNSGVTVSQSGDPNQANQPNTTNVATPQVDKATLTTIEWLDGTNRDFGKITEGKKLDVVFRFKNTGDKPLIISDVTAGCGCTVPEKPSKPYAPGETGEIKAAFDSNGKPGAQSKNVNVFANTEPQMTTLLFRVEVKAKS